MFNNSFTSKAKIMLVLCCYAVVQCNMAIAENEAAVVATSANGAPAESTEATSSDGAPAASSEVAPAAEAQSEAPNDDNQPTTDVPVNSEPIKTPIEEDRNIFVIKSPMGLGYRTLNGENGLIGVFWPSETTFKDTQKAVFVFLQNDKKKLPKTPDNLNLFTEKCQKSMFKFSKKNENDPTLSIEERYFNGTCGRTMVLFHKKIEHYNVVLACVSSKHISREELTNAKIILKRYNAEIKKYNNEVQATPRSAPQTAPAA